MLAGNNHVDFYVPKIDVTVDGQKIKCTINGLTLEDYQPTEVILCCDEDEGSIYLKVVTDYYGPEWEPYQQVVVVPSDIKDTHDGTRERIAILSQL